MLVLRMSYGFLRLYDIKLHSTTAVLKYVRYVTFLNQVRAGRRPAQT